MQKLPIHDSVHDLSEQLDYFIQKIVIIRNGLRQSTDVDNRCDDTDVISILESLKPATNEEISKMIRSSASKSWSGPYSHLGPRLLTWFNFNPSMHK